MYYESVIFMRYNSSCEKFGSLLSSSEGHRVIGIYVGVHQIDVMGSLTLCGLPGMLK